MQVSVGAAKIVRKGLPAVPTHGPARTRDAGRNGVEWAGFRDFRCRDVTWCAARRHGPPQRCEEGPAPWVQRPPQPGRLRETRQRASGYPATIWRSTASRPARFSASFTNAGRPCGRTQNTTWRRGDRSAPALASFSLPFSGFRLAKSPDTKAARVCLAFKIGAGNRRCSERLCWPSRADERRFYA
jgi:hypothetical protein